MRQLDAAATRASPGSTASADDLPGRRNKPERESRDAGPDQRSIHKARADYAAREQRAGDASAAADQSGRRGRGSLAEKRCRDSAKPPGITREQREEREDRA